MPSISKFGRNRVVANNTTEDVTADGGSYDWATANETLFISSSDDTDTMVLTIKKPLKEVGDEWLEQPNEVITLTGQTQKTILGSYIRTNRMSVKSTNAGIIYLYATSGNTGGVPDTATSIRATIAVGACQTEMALWTVPSNWGPFSRAWIWMIRPGLNNVDGASGAREVDYVFCQRPYGEDFTVVENYPVVKDGNQSPVYYPPAPWPTNEGLPGKTDLLVTASAEGGACDCSFSFQVVSAPNGTRYNPGSVRT